ncbi:hypothetical protein H0H93_011769 [Arthromyces matolae]|nr:hypothetical protein H0H93_011769 [Arthromyces matolae]
MFFYISFLRPPPIQSAASGNIQITPQVSNDLRTEPFDGSVDIFYSWSQTAGFSSSKHRELVTKPVKLTTWRQATAYKEIPVPLPPGLRDGQSWRLILGTRITAGPDGFTSIDLCDQDLGRASFPVMSMPIRFGPHIFKKGQKQEQIERQYIIRPKVGDDPGVVLRLTEQTSFDLDKVRGCLLYSIGTGIGVVGLGLAALRSTGPVSSATVKDRIVITDLGPSSVSWDNLISSFETESAIPLIEHNIASNSTHLTNVQLDAAVLDWDANELPDFVKEFPEGFDAIIMADVTYNTASFPSLVRTLSKLVQLGKRPPLVLLGYKERDVAERSLWNLIEEIGLSFRKVGQCVGAGGEPVEDFHALEPFHLHRHLVRSLPLPVSKRQTTFVDEAVLVLVCDGFSSFLLFLCGPSRVILRDNLLVAMPACEAQLPSGFTDWLTRIPNWWWHHVLSCLSIPVGQTALALGYIIPQADK